MILRRFIVHIEEQNWFAVGLDVIVVIVGIFLGMQVTEWNEERKNQYEEKRLLTDLHTDLTNAIARVDSLLERMSEYNRTIDLAARKIFSTEFKGSLSDDECRDIARGHIAPHLKVKGISTLEEVLATGKLPLISDRELRKEVLKMHSQLELDSDQIDFVVNDLKNLPDNHANLFPRMLTEHDDVAVQCDIDRIRSDQTVMNKIVSNRGRHLGIEGRFTQQRKALLELKTLIENTLKAEHLNKG